MSELAEEIVRAIDAGQLSEDQLRELIRIEAEALDLTYEEAVRRARKGDLPRNLIADDLEFLVELLPDAA